MITKKLLRHPQFSCDYSSTELKYDLWQKARKFLIRRSSRLVFDVVPQVYYAYLTLQYLYG